MEKSNIIELKNLTKMYGSARGVIDLNLEIKSGEIFGFIGPNGAGKSTAIRCILGLIHPTNGEIKVFGNSVDKHYFENSKEIGYLPSEVFYYEGMKVIDLLNYSASFYHGNFEDKILKLAKQLDLDLNKKISSLSFGNRKKVGIIQCLLHEPKLIILDEPTSGLDPLIQQKFFELLEEENKRGATIFLSSHILSEVQRLCGRVAIIKEGKIIKIEEIKKLKQDNYKKVSLNINESVDKDFFNLKGVENLIINKNDCNFLYKGDINLLVEKLSKLKIDNLNIVEPDLEEIFLHYYE